VEKKIAVLMQDPEYRELQESHMRHLLELTERAPEIPELAHAYALHTAMRAHDRWHPYRMRRQEVRGVEWLTTKMDPERGVLLSFMHHNKYAGLFASLARVGAPILIVALPAMLEPDVDPAMRQHMRIVMSGKGTRTIPASGGTDFIAEQLVPGVRMAVASDIPGRTEVTFLGRKVWASFGAARIAFMRDAPVVVVTAQREPDGREYLQVHPPIDPRDFDDPRPLLDAMLAVHEKAILAWPEALESPLRRMGAEKA
jgi:lauroyl/myristoyl acyltransferase